MLSQMKREKKNHADFTADKHHLYVTGYLQAPVTKGKPAMYVYNGNTIKTSSVVQIIAASKEFITFETLNSIYTISYIYVPSEGCALSA